MRQLRGGDLSPLLPAQKLAESRANVENTFGRAMTGDQAALADLPQMANDFLSASRAYNASSEAYTQDFTRVMDLLARAGAASTAIASQTGVLEQIKAELQKPSPDTAILNAQKDLLGIGFDQSVALLQQLVDLTGQKRAEDLAAEQHAVTQRLAEQQSAQATAAYQAQKAISDANLAQFRGYVSTMPGGEHIANAAENIAANAPFSYSYFEAYVGEEAAAFAQARELQAQYMDAFSAAYDLYKAIPGHAAGLAYVPQDDYLMRAHRGEAVVPADTMATLRSFGIQVGAGITKADIDRLCAAVAEAKDAILYAAESSDRAVRDQTNELKAASKESARDMGNTIAGAIDAKTLA